MAEDKISFVLYSDQRGQFDKLNDEQAGQLIKHIFAYVNLEHPVGDFITELAFEPIRTQLKRDKKKWESVIEKRSDAGKASAAARKNKRQQASTKATHVESVETNSTNPTVSVNGSVNVTVSDNVNVNEITTKPLVQNRYAQDVIDCVKNCLEHFDGHLHPKTPKQKLQWCEVVEKLNRIDGIPYQQIEAITEWARSDEFWASNFLALPKLRKKNKDGLLWILVFSEKLKRNDNNKPLTEQQQQIANSRSVQNIIDRRKEDRRRAELSNDSTTD
jgi:hypothetical protein